jgi:hypothetical protein
MKRIILTLLGLLLIEVNASGQSLQVGLGGRIDTLQFGAPLGLTLTVDAPAGGTLLLPDLAQALAPLELLSAPDTTISEGDGRSKLELTIQATCYAKGENVVEPIQVRWISADGSLTDSAAAEAFPFTVLGIVPDSILAMADTTTQAHHLLLSNRARLLPYSFWEIARWLLLAAAVAGIFLLMRYFIRRRRRESGEIDAGPPPRPAHEIALEELDALRDERLYQAGKIKEYYSGLSEIVRRYFEARYRIRAMESTSFQFLRDIKRYLSEADLQSILENLLSDADLAKFAKHQPDATTCQKDLESGYTLVEKTKPKPSPVISGEAA